MPVKKSSVFICFITMILLFIVPSMSSGEEIKVKKKDYNTIQIYIKLKPYKGKKFYHEDGKIYTKLDDLKKAMDFTYSFDKVNNKLLVNEQEYTGDHILQNEKILYVSLVDISYYLGYKVNYDGLTNIMDISTSGVITNTIEVIPRKG